MHAVHQYLGKAPFRGSNECVEMLEAHRVIMMNVTLHALPCCEAPTRTKKKKKKRGAPAH
jgi:hypothetical protein